MDWWWKMMYDVWCMMDDLWWLTDESGWTMWDCLSMMATPAMRNFTKVAPQARGEPSGRCDRDLTPSWLETPMNYLCTFEKSKLIYFHFGCTIWSQMLGRSGNFNALRSLEGLMNHRKWPRAQFSNEPTAPRGQKVIAKAAGGGGGEGLNAMGAAECVLADTLGNSRNHSSYGYSWIELFDVSPQAVGNLQWAISWEVSSDSHRSLLWFLRTAGQECCAFLACPSLVGNAYIDFCWMSEMHHVSVFFLWVFLLRRHFRGIGECSRSDLSSDLLGIFQKSRWTRKICEDEEEMSHTRWRRGFGGWKLPWERWL